MLLACSALYVVAGPVYAQDTAAAAPETNEFYADEIVVTATRRAESVQDVPIAVSVVGGELVQNAGVNDIRGVQPLAVSLEANTGQSAAPGTSLSIRGIGTAGAIGRASCRGRVCQYV